MKVILQTIVQRLLREYYNEIQDALASWMNGDIDVDQLEDILVELDDEYSALIVDEF